MSKIPYDYEPDEFDEPAPQGAPTAVHEAQRSGWSKTWPFLVVIVVFAGLAYGGFGYLTNQASKATSASSSSSSSSPATKKSTSSAPSTSSSPPQTATQTPSQTPTPTETTTPAQGNVDKAMAVRVSNATNIAGLAATGKDTLAKAGYSNVTTGDYSGEKYSDNMVFYANKDDEATALDVANAFGIPEKNVQLTFSLKYGAHVAVILEKDYRQP